MAILLGEGMSTGRQLLEELRRMRSLGEPWLKN
jgi:hypothetical protein